MQYVQYIIVAHSTMLFFVLFIIIVIEPCPHEHITDSEISIYK